MLTRSLRSTVAGAAGASQASGSGSQVLAAQDKDAKKAMTENYTRNKRKKAKLDKKAALPEAKDELGPLQLFLSMPLDIFAIICTHLTTKDLLNLSHTAKVFRKPLVDLASGRSIWAAQRRATGLPIFKNMSEIAFSHLIYSESCHGCGSTEKAVELNLDFRARLCRECRKSMFVCLQVEAPLGDARTSLQGERVWISTKYSPTDVDTVPTGSEHWLSRQCYLLRKDLEKVNEELMSLQEDDDETEAARQAATLRRGTKSRPNTQLNLVENTSKVETFVAAKIACLHTVAEENEKVQTALNLMKIRERERALEEWRALRALQLARRNDIVARVKTSLLAKGWNDTKFNQALHCSDCDTLYCDKFYNGHATVLEDAEWTSLEPAIIVLLEDGYTNYLADRARKALLVTQRAHKDALAIRFLALRTAASAKHRLAFPELFAFYNFPEIFALWKDPSSIIDDVTWAKVLPALQAEITTRRHNLRVEAVRAILASKGFSADKINIEVRDNLESYSSAYFQRVTSLFHGHRGRLREYPYILDDFGDHGLSQRKSKLSTKILRKIVEASGMGEAATAVELDKLAPVLCFAEDTAPGTRYSWRKLYRAVYKIFRVKEPNARRSAAMTISLAPPVAAAS